MGTMSEYIDWQPENSPIKVRVHRALKELRDKFHAMEDTSHAV